MKKVFKSLIIFSIMCVLCFSCGIVALAESSVQDKYGIDVQITTDKEEYTDSDNIEVSYTLSNTNIAPLYEINNVLVEVTADQTLVDMGLVETTQKINTLKYGYPVPNTQMGTVDTGKSIVHKTVPTDKLVSDSITFSEVNDAIPQTTVQKTAETGGKAPIILAVILGVIAVATVVLALFKRKKAAVSLMLALLIVVQVSACPVPVSAADNLETVSFTVSKEISVNGTPHLYSVRVTVNELYVNNDIEYFTDRLDTSIICEGDINAIPVGIDDVLDHKYDDVVMKFIDNGQIRLGANLGAGGSITYLASAEGGVNENTNNMVNNYDLGRQIQLSAYNGPKPYYSPGKEQNASYKTLGFNPIQAGDAGGYGSRVTAFYQTDTFMYIKTRPNLWPQYDCPAECTFEFTYTLVDNYVDVQYRINMERENFTQEELEQISKETGVSIETLQENNNERQYYANGIECPAIYVNGDWFKWVFYSGTEPFTGDALTETTSLGGSSSTIDVTEHWAALVTPTENYGLGVYHPDSTSCRRITSGAMGGTDDRDIGSAYISPVLTEILDYNIVFDGYYALIIGTVDEIRDTVYELHGVENKGDVISYDFTNNDRHGWHYGTDWAMKTIDKGYGNQDCLDFQISSSSSTMYGPHVFFTPKDNKTITFDAAFTSDENTDKEFYATISFKLFNGIMPAALPTTITAEVPIEFKADGIRREYTVKLDDYYDYISAAGCKQITVTFSGEESDVAAQIYSIEMK